MVKTFRVRIEYFLTCYHENGLRDERII